MTMQTDHSLLSDEEIRAELQKYEFYHSIKVNDRITTPGVDTFRGFQNLIFSALARVEFAGASVLDIGCRDGLFLFHAEEQGAQRLVGIDNCLSVGTRDFLIPYRRSKIELEELGLFDLPQRGLGQFDIVLFLGVLYHLRYPFDALRIVADAVAEGGTVVVETGIFADDNRRALLHCPIGEESPYEPSSCTFFNLKGMRDSLRCFGLIVTSEHFHSPADAVATDGRIIRAVFTCTKASQTVDSELQRYWLGQSHKTWQK